MKGDFFSLPPTVKENLLWDIQLEYDWYESNKAEEIHCILHSHVNEINKAIINNYWLALSESSFLAVLTEIRNDLERQLDLTNKEIAKLI